MSNTFSIRNKIAIHICDTYFGGSRSLKGKIIKDMSPLKADYLLKLQQVLENQRDYISNAVSKKQEAGGFNTPLGKFRYLYSIAGRLIKEAEYKPERHKQEPKQPSAIPSQSKAVDRPAWMNELEADSQPPKQASTEDKPAISDSDLLETGPDAIHAAWTKLSEDERRKNWTKAIAVHRQQHPPKYYDPDEMY